MGMRRLRIAIDIGGTFTDLVAYDEATKELHTSKTASTPPDFIDGVINGLEKAGVRPEEIVQFRHGSTIATNAIIERRGAKTGMITTRGMRDVLEAARANRPDLFNSNWDPSPPLVQRRHVLEATERVDYEGAVLTELDEEDVRLAAKKFRARGIEAVAVAYLNSFMNPSHEVRTREILQEELGADVFVCTSAETLPEIREFERTSTTAANAYLAPVVDRYLDRLLVRLREWGYRGEIGVTHSGGGLMSAAAARRTPARICQSGPAGGVVGGVFIGKLAGFDNVITFDMGGTSADLSLATDGRPRMASEWRVDWNIPILFPAIDLVTIGAGGGTIAWIDAGGSLRSGPHSAGANPGPACVNKGNKEATNTDAQLFLGRLNPETYLGGDVKIFPDLAAAAIHKLADQVGLSPEETASGMLRIANANMTSATHLISVQRGYDPRDFTIVAGGGAGPLHAVDIARDIGIPRVVVPLTPGLESALGILQVDLRHDYQRSILKRVQDLEAEELVRSFQDLLDEAKRMFNAEGVPENRRGLELSLDVRYYGQTPYMNLRLDVPPRTAKDIERIVKSYEERYLREFGYVLPRDFASVEFVNARVAALGTTDAVDLNPKRAARGVKDALKGTRRVYFEDAKDFVPTKIYDRALLSNGAEIAGPAVIEQTDSTVVLPPRAAARIDNYLNVVIAVNG
jgi:N-methylhydantoinase A